MAADLVGVGRAQVNVLEAVERERHRELAARLPAPRMLLVIRPVARNGLSCFGKIPVEHLVAGARGRPLEDGRSIPEILQMALAHERGRIAGCAQRIDERVAPQRQRRAVAAHAMHRGHAPGHQGGPVRHANRRRHIESIEARAAGGDRVDMRRLEHRMPIAAEIVGAVLIGDEEEEIRAHVKGA